VQTIRHAADLKTNGRKVCIAIGVFDGVHLGHQQIIRQTIADARQHDGISLVVTFDRHPKAIVAADRMPPAIYPLSQKLRAIESLGVDATLLIEFTREFSEQTAGKFIQGLVRDLGHLQSICVGADFVFGHQRSGNVALLRQMGAEFGFVVHGMAAVALDGAVVSSTRIRAAVQAGDFDAASQMLGRPFSIVSSVVAGDQLGHQLGFPTANLNVSGLVLPPDGVYAARVLINPGGAGGSSAAAVPPEYHAVLNLGLRPTIASASPERRFEVHLLDFAGDLYNCQLEVEFILRLRDEIKFDSLDALKAQIAADVEAARKCF
jgi:riboflavin kinase/FMN adenylyltransferase